MKAWVRCYMPPHAQDKLIKFENDFYLIVAAILVSSDVG